MPAIIVLGTSVACSASFDRGLDRKEIPKSLTKVARRQPEGKREGDAREADGDLQRLRSGTW